MRKQVSENNQSATETPSIFSRKKTESKENQTSSLSKEVRSTEYTNEQLQEAWQSFRKERSVEVGEMEGIVLSRPLQKDAEGPGITISLLSSVELSILDRFEIDLVAFLRNTLDNDAIIVNKEVVEPVDDAKKLYTSKDKYEYMVKLNPALKDLKEKLGLDFEY